MDFDFVLNVGTPHDQALGIVRRADVFLDQFVTGGYGVAAIEAMALGKPVVCYVKPSLASQYPSDQPIVNANQDNLATVLESLLKDGQLRAELGRRSRAYVERHHDAHKIAHHLMEIYRQLL
jgi:glycosyltransferase involved in cell wall biosynthesis